MWFRQREGEARTLKTVSEVSLKQCINRLIWVPTLMLAMGKNAILFLFAKKEGIRVALIVPRNDGPVTQLSQLVNIKALHKAHDADYNAVRKMNLPLEVE